MRMLDWLRIRSIEPTEIQWVGQEEGMGCAIACVAMLLGTTYGSARALFPRFDPAEGVLPLDAVRVLSEYGWASVEKFRHYSPEGRDRRRWPVRPFAPVHLVPVSTTGWHAVLLLADGMVLDPLTPVPQRLSDYAVVHSVIGLWRVA
jgi:hypothetical protein